MDGNQSNLSAMKIKPLAGTEVFHRQGVALNHNLADFWRWAYSNLAANNLRGHLAEFLVGSELGVIDQSRVEWANYDLRTRAGIKVEVKSAAYLQTWKQSRCSTISFGVAPSRSFNAAIGKREQKSVRGADVYVFCLLAHKDKSTLDPMNMDQWQFFVVATRTIDAAIGAQESLSLSRLLKLGPIQCSYGGISSAIDKVMEMD